MLTSELGSTFRDEGGPYVWTKLAMGRLPASLNSVLYWLSNPVWLGGALTITAYEVFTQFFYDPSKHYGSNGVLAVQIVFGLAFIWIATWSFGIGKWIPTVGAWVRVILLSVFVLSVVLYAMKHGVHGVSGGDVSPTTAIFFTAVPVLFFNFVGFELPSSAGDEMKDPQKDVPVTIRRAWLVAILALRLADPVHPAGAAFRSDHQPRRVRRRHQDGIHGVRRLGHHQGKRHGDGRPHRGWHNSRRARGGRLSSGRCCRAGPPG